MQVTAVPWAAYCTWASPPRALKATQTGDADLAAYSTQRLQRIAATAQKMPLMACLASKAQQSTARQLLLALSPMPKAYPEQQR